jgi:uncharacterized protein (TIGR03435 family)
VAGEPIGSDDFVAAGIICNTSASPHELERKTMKSAPDFQAGAYHFTRSIGLCLIVISACSVWGQSEEHLQFEAASIKPTTASTGRSGIEETPGLIRIENLSLKAIIEAAYGVKDYQCTGPGWMAIYSFDIAAKAPAGYRHEQLQPLLRNLLADRFKLAVHHESKEMPGFALAIAKGEQKLREATKAKGFFTVRPGLIEGTRVSTAQLANALARILARPVVDNTGLTAMYDVKLEWTPDQISTRPDGEDKTGPAEPGISVYQAIHDQLGLRLQTQKVPLDTVVVDRVEKVPSEN